MELAERASLAMVTISAYRVLVYFLIGNSPAEAEPVWVWFAYDTARYIDLNVQLTLSPLFEWFGYRAPSVMVMYAIILALGVFVLNSFARYREWMLRQSTIPDASDSDTETAESKREPLISPENWNRIAQVSAAALGALFLGLVVNALYDYLKYLVLN